MSGTKPTRFLILCILCASVAFSAGQETNREPAKLKVSGYGVFGNREMKGLISVLQTGEEKPEVFEANYVEDAVLVMFSRLRHTQIYPPSPLQYSSAPRGSCSPLSPSRNRAAAAHPPGF